jgi:hypothetical protein
MGGMFFIIYYTNARRENECVMKGKSGRNHANCAKLIRKAFK